MSRPYRGPFVRFVFRGLRTRRVLPRGYDESRPYRAFFFTALRLIRAYRTVECRALIGRRLFDSSSAGCALFGCLPAAMVNPALIGRFHPPLRGESASGA